MSSVTKFPTSEVQTTPGSRAWNSIGALGADDTSYDTAYTMTAGGWDRYIQLISGGNLTGDNKKSSSQYPTGGMATATYGGSTDKWNVALTAAIVNASNFGIGIAVAGNAAGDYSSYIVKATGFGFAIPAGSSIDGVLATICRYATGGYTYVDYVTLTVYYSETSIKAKNGLVKASVKVVNSLAIASVKGIDGLT